MRLEDKTKIKWRLHLVDARICDSEMNDLKKKYCDLNAFEEDYTRDSDSIPIKQPLLFWPFDWTFPFLCLAQRRRRDLNT